MACCSLIIVGGGRIMDGPPSKILGARAPGAPRIDVPGSEVQLLMAPYFTRYFSVFIQSLLMVVFVQLACCRVFVARVMICAYTALFSCSFFSAWLSQKLLRVRRHDQLLKGRSHSSLFSIWWYSCPRYTAVAHGGADISPRGRGALSERVKEVRFVVVCRTSEWKVLGTNLVHSHWAL